MSQSTLVNHFALQKRDFRYDSQMFF